MCVFCQIGAGEAPAVTLYRDDKVMAIMDIMPLNRGHVLVIPLEHAETLDALSPEAAADSIQLVQKVGGAMMASALEPQGYNLIQANGAAAGQTVFHVHLHIVPRYGEPMSALRPDRKRSPVNPTELAEIASLIEAHLPWHT